MGDSTFSRLMVHPNPGKKTVSAGEDLIIWTVGSASKEPEQERIITKRRLGPRTRRTNERRDRDLTPPGAARWAVPARP